MLFNDLHDPARIYGGGGSDALVALGLYLTGFTRALAPVERLESAPVVAQSADPAFFAARSVARNNAAGECCGGLPALQSGV